MTEQQILDRMASREEKIEKIAALYSSKDSNVNKLANMKRENNAEYYDEDSLNKTFARTLLKAVEQSKAAAARIVR